MIDQCSWSHPGADPYLGTAAAWIARAPLTAEVQAELLARVTANDFTDIVYISRNGISSANPTIRNIRYDPHLSFMAFGAHGRICNEVSILDLPETQSAIVFCSRDGTCIARPSVCNNWTIILRQPDEPVPDSPPEATPIAEGGAPAPVGLPVLDLPAPPADSPLPVYGWEGSGGDSGGGFYPVGSSAGGGGGGGGYCPPVVTPPISPVPEPATWATILAGLFLLLNKARKGRRTFV